VLRYHWQPFCFLLMTQCCGIECLLGCNRRIHAFELRTNTLDTGYGGYQTHPKAIALFLVVYHIYSMISLQEILMWDRLFLLSPVINWMLMEEVNQGCFGSYRQMFIKRFRIIANEKDEHIDRHWMFTLYDLVFIIYNMLLSISKVYKVIVIIITLGCSPLYDLICRNIKYILCY
jgi:hypothetical protein